MMNLMLNAEKNCRKMYSNHYQYSPPVKGWLDRCHLCRALIQMKVKMKKKGTTNPQKINMNVSNILRAAEQCGIENGWTLSLDNLYVRYKICKEHTKSLMAESPAFRKILLSQQLTDAMS